MVPCIFYGKLVHGSYYDVVDDRFLWTTSLCSSEEKVECDCFLCYLSHEEIGFDEECDCFLCHVIFVKYGEFQISTTLTINKVHLRLEWNKLFH